MRRLIFCACKVMTSLLQETSTPLGVRFRLRIQPVVATWLLLAQSLVCCIDRINPPPEADRPSLGSSVDSRLEQMDVRREVVGPGRCDLP